MVQKIMDETKILFKKKFWPKQKIWVEKTFGSRKIVGWEYYFKFQSIRASLKGVCTINVILPQKINFILQKLLLTFIFEKCLILPGKMRIKRRKTKHNFKKWEQVATSALWNASFELKSCLWCKVPLNL